MGKGKDGCLECCAVCGAAAFCCLLAVIVVALLGLGIAKIVMGAIYLHDCKIEYLIPVYLIVSGVAPILFGGFGRRGEEENSGSDPCGLVCGMIGFFFNLAWLICGSVWVYPNYGKLVKVDFAQCTVNLTSNCVQEGCNEGLITFAFAVVTIDWLFMGLWIGLIGFLIGKTCCK